EQVEVDRARAVARPLAHAAELLLHGEQLIEEICRRERGLDRDGAVEEARLVEVADGIGLPERRDGDHLDTGSLFQQLDGALQRRLAVREIRAQPPLSPDL